MMEDECCPDRTVLIQIERLQVAYAGRAALSIRNLEINRGCLTAVIGPSGCGKTTFLHVLNRMTDELPGCTVEGKAIFQGADLLARDIDLRAHRKQVGLIFQRPNPFPFSIRRNLEFPLRNHGMRDRDKISETIEKSLRRAGLWNEVKDRLDKNALTLSGGQQQRLCIARALTLNPEVLLMDEPCSSLDPISTRVIEELLQEMRGNLTLVVVTHNLAQARRIADDVAMFWTFDGRGELTESGPARQVFAKPREEITAAYLSGERG